LKRRTFLLRASAVGAVAAVGGTTATVWARTDRPTALVYRGPATSPGCPEAVARLLESAPNPLRAVYVGPGEEVPLSREALAGAVIYAQPAGGEVEPAWRHMRGYAGLIRDWTRSGGRYLGFCLGAYLAGTTPGFGLLPGDTGQYISSRGATIDTTRDTIAEVSWRGQRRHMFFQDGPVFRLTSSAPATVLATYDNGEIAAVVTRFGSGSVAVVGPHPEADQSWYTDDGLTNPDGIRFEMGYDLINTAMAF
jgi:glutamine amidotransferase-like uncharacterized protein